MSAIAFDLIIFITIFSFILLRVSKEKSLFLKRVVEVFFYVSFAFMGYLWFVVKNSYPAHINIRLDLLLISPCLLIQAFIVWEGRMQVRDSRMINKLRNKLSS